MPTDPDQLVTDDDDHTEHQPDHDESLNPYLKPEDVPERVEPE